MPFSPKACGFRPPVTGRARGVWASWKATRPCASSNRAHHMDETGFRIGGTTRRLHVASTALLTFYRVCAKRGSLLANVAGIVIHDHWKPLYGAFSVKLFF